MNEKRMAESDVVKMKMPSALKKEKTHASSGVAATTVVIAPPMTEKSRTKWVQGKKWGNVWTLSRAAVESRHNTDVLGRHYVFAPPRTSRTPSFKK